MKTLEIYSLDPRASDILQAVAERFGDEVYPGEVILDEAGNRVGSTRTLFTVTNAGGRAVPALMSVAEMDYLFQVQNVVVFTTRFAALLHLMVGDKIWVKADQCRPDAPSPKLNPD